MSKIRLVDVAQLNIKCGITRKNDFDDAIRNCANKKRKKTEKHRLISTLVKC